VRDGIGTIVAELERLTSIKKESSSGEYATIIWNFFSNLRDWIVSSVDQIGYARLQS
jgi:hypothetical protein